MVDLLSLTNTFLANGFILCPPKTLENLLFSVFRGYKMRTLVGNRLTLNYITLSLKASCLKICDASHDLVPFLLFKKREKHPWRGNTFSFSLQLY